MTPFQRVKSTKYFEGYKTSSANLGLEYNKGHIVSTFYQNHDLVHVDLERQKSSLELILLASMMASYKIMLRCRTPHTTNSLGMSVQSHTRRY